jgi:(p)ppGpp synthase/HD superfamily hydrolase
MTKLEEAIAVASMVHADQVDKAGKPYILHCLRVMLALSKESEDVQIVGVLHDAVEDTTTTLDDIRLTFGPYVADAIDALTHRKAAGETYRDYIERCAANPIAARVKLADLVDNLAPDRIGALSVQHVKRYVKALAHLQGNNAAL